jgi:hypothetical protein
MQSRYVFSQINQTLGVPIKVTQYLKDPGFIQQTVDLLRSPKTLSIEPSTLPNAGMFLLPGLGVFLKGIVDCNEIVCLYPGTVYQPWDPKLLVSVRNHYLLRYVFA